MRHLIKITSKTEEMVPSLVRKIPQKRSPANDYTETSFTEFTPTGFGQLPVPRQRTFHSRLKNSRLLTNLLAIALILCLAGIIYLLIFVTLFNST